jgi:hypothetical protein
MRARTVTRRALCATISSTPPETLGLPATGLKQRPGPAATARNRLPCGQALGLREYRHRIDGLLPRWLSNPKTASVFKGVTQNGP